MFSLLLTRTVNGKVLHFKAAVGCGTGKRIFASRHITFDILSGFVLVFSHAVLFYPHILAVFFLFFLPRPQAPVSFIILTLVLPCPCPLFAAL